jgi:phage terminase large subunit-like protein
VRRFRIACIEIAHKNGKSELLAFVALYMLAESESESESESGAGVGVVKGVVPNM